MCIFIYLRRIETPFQKIVYKHNSCRYNINYLINMNMHYTVQEYICLYVCEYKINMYL